MLSSKKYLRKINNHIKELECEKEKIEKDIEKTEKRIENEKKEINSIVEKKEKLETTFKSLKKVLVERGLTFEIDNVKGIAQWDNLKILKKSKKFVITNSENQVVKELDEDISEIMSDIKNDNVNISTLVLRKTSQSALVQIRFTPYDEI